MNLLPSLASYSRYGQDQQDTNDPYAEHRDRLKGMRAEAMPPPPPTEGETGMLPRIMGMAQYLGETLDKPRAGVGGLISGDPSQLANWIPFSDAMGLTNAKPGDKTVFGTEPITHEGSKKYGSDLLTQAGMPTAPEEWSWENAPAKIGRGALGIGIDVVTDPLFYITGPLGMLSKSEKAAKALKLTAEGQRMNTLEGVSTLLKATDEVGPSGLKAVLGPWADVARTGPKGFASEVAAGERSLFGVGMPWSKEPWLEFNLMPKEWAAKVVEHGMMGQYSPVKWFRGIFSPMVAANKITLNKADQVANEIRFTAQKYYSSAAENISAVLAKVQPEVEESWQSIASHFVDNKDIKSGSDLQRILIEAYSKFPQAQDWGNHLLAMAGVTNVDETAKIMAMAQRSHEVVGAMHDVSKFLNDTLMEWGGRASLLEDNLIEHGSRYSSAAMQKWLAERAAKAGMSEEAYLSSRTNPSIMRKIHRKDTPGGTLTQNSIARDESFYNKEWVTDPVTQERQLVDLSPARARTKYLDEIKDLFRTREADIRASMTAAGQTPPVGQILGEYWFDPARLTSKTKPMTLTELRVAHLNEFHIRPAHEAAWPKAPGGMPNNEQRVSRFLDANGVPEVLTEAGERARWIEGTQARKIIKSNKLLHRSYGDKFIEDGIFDRSLMQDTMDASKNMVSRLATVMSAHRLLEEKGVLGKVSNGFVGVSLEKAWTKSGFKRPGLRKIVENQFGGELQSAVDNALGVTGLDITNLMQSQGLEVSAARDLIRRNVLTARASQTPIAGTVDEFIANTLKAETEKASDAITKNLAIHPEMAGSLRAYNGTTQFNTQNEIIKGLDWAKTLYQKALYNIFPKSYFRDILGHTFNHWSAGDTDLKNILGGYKDVQSYLKTGKGPAEESMRILVSLGGIKSSDLNDMYMKTFEGKGLPMGGFWHNATHGELVTKPAAEIGNTTRVVTPSWLDKIENSKVNVAAQWDRGMSRTRRYTDVIQRGGYFHALLQTGNFSPAQALERMRNASFDHVEQSAFSKNVMNRAYLFWGFKSKNIPYQLSNIMAQPGGRTAQTMKAMSQVASQSDPNVYTPSFMQERQSMPVGIPNPSAQSFATTTAIPFTDLNDIVIGGGIGNTVQRTAEKTSSGLAPWFLGPLELSAKRQFTTGRDIADLETISGNKALDTFLHYSPASRVFSEYGSMTHPDKSLTEKLISQTGIGGVSNYDTEKWKLIDIRNAYRKKMTEEGLKPWTNYYVPDKLKETATTQELLVAEQDRKRNEAYTQMMKALIAKRDAKHEQ